MFPQYPRPDRLQHLSHGPQKIVWGAGAVHAAASACQDLGLGSVLVVTDETVASEPVLRVLLETLRGAGIAATVYDGVTTATTDAQAEAALAKYEAGRCDGVVSLGGGSVTDCGKAVALLASNGTLREHALGGAPRPVKEKRPHVAIGTTAGPGSEFNAFLFILEEEGKGPLVLESPLLLPEVAIVDPRAHTADARTSAATGLSALSDALEALFSTVGNEESDRLALSAVRGIRALLPRACEGDAAARDGMAEAAYDAARAYAHAGLGIADCVALAASALLGVGHSEAKAMVLPRVIAHIAGAAPEDAVRTVAKALGADLAGLDADDPAAGAVRAVERLRRDVGFTDDLPEMDWNDVYLFQGALRMHPFTKRSPRPLDEDGLKQILLPKQ